MRARFAIHSMVLARCHPTLDPHSDDHLLGRGHANVIEVKHLDIVGVALRDRAGDRRLPRARSANQNDKLHSPLAWKHRTSNDVTAGNSK
jgi:hypothetical protein